MEPKILIETLVEKIKFLEQTNDFLLKKIADLEAELTLYKNKKNSNNSHIPPSQDPNRPTKNQSLRLKTDKKPGGQLGHRGTTLECNRVIDEVIDHNPNFCNNCGRDLSEQPSRLLETRQVIDIPIIKPTCIEHRIYRKTCSCGHCMDSSFPESVVASIQYGAGVESLAGYLHARQYLPYQRMQEFFSDVMNLPVSVGGIHNILNRLSKKALPFYQQIKERISAATFVGTDETSVKVNGQNNWLWTWQNDDLTFIAHADNRSFKTIETQFPQGLPNSVLQHDRYACHFNCQAKKHQICMAHLLRDLKYIIELYDNQCQWACELKELITQALWLKKQLVATDYLGQNEHRNNLIKKLEILLNTPLNEEHGKAKTLSKNLVKNKDSIFNFLWYADVPPDNNGSERAIRNAKVKQKISGQFKSDQGANCFAVLRSIIDTTTKSGKKVLEALSLIAKLGAE